MKNIKFTDTDFFQFRDFILEKSGLSFGDNLKDNMRLVLADRLKETKIDSYTDYYNYLNGSIENVSEIRKLINSLTIGETSFFRNKPIFEAFRLLMLPEIISKKSNEFQAPINIFSSGCSTGEEPYTFAMSIMSNSNYQNFNILAADINLESLAKAELGIYEKYSLRNAGENYIQNYFGKINDNKYKIADSVKKNVQFKYLNLAEEEFSKVLPYKFDVISCQNVFIYFKTDLYRKIINKFYDILEDDGYLIIGPSESLFKISEKYEQIHFNDAIFYRKKIDCGDKNEFNLKKILNTKPFLQTDSSLITLNNNKIKLRKEQEQPVVYKHYDLGKEYFKKNMFDSAAAEFEKYISANQYSLEVRILAAKSYAESNDIPSAIKHCEAALQINPLNPELHFLLGIFYKQTDKIEKAEEYLKKTIYLNNDSALANFYLANLYSECNRYNEAQRKYQSALLALQSENANKDVSDYCGYSPEYLKNICKTALERMEKQTTNIG